MHIVVTVNMEMQERGDRIRLRHPPWVPRWVGRLLTESCSEEERDDTRPSSRRRKRRRNERPVSESHLVEKSALCEVADRGDGIEVDQHCQGDQGDSAAPA